MRIWFGFTFVYLSRGEVILNSKLDLKDEDQIHNRNLGTYSRTKYKLKLKKTVNGGTVNRGTTVLGNPNNETN